MTDGDPIEPNAIADTYQALSELHQLVSRLVVAREKITGETESTLHTYSDLIGEKRAEFGEATANRNQFTIQEYRETFDDDLPTIKTSGLTSTEHEILEALGIIDEDERFRLPNEPHTGERLHFLPYGKSLNRENAILQEFTVPQPAVTLFHIGDTHLGYRNRAKPGGGGNTNWVDKADSLEAFQMVVQRAIKEDIDAVVHTGDIFDHDVDQNTLRRAKSSLRSLADNGIQFYFILGDHDRQATGGEIPGAQNAVSDLESLCESGTITYCASSEIWVKEKNIALFGVDATDIGFEEIQEGYTLNSWSPKDLDFDLPQTSESNILCLHEPHGKMSLSEVIEVADSQGRPLDLILLGHEHRPPFDGEWETTIEGVQVAYAGPTIPISKHFNKHPPGYNRIRIGANWNISVGRRELTS